MNTPLYRNNILPMLLAVVLVLSTLLPTYAPVFAGMDGKVAICTTDGVRYVDAGEVGGGLPERGEHNPFPHCPLCVIGGSANAKAPQLESQPVCYQPSRSAAIIFEKKAAPQIIAFYATPSAPRAPPEVL